jgi:hypothetical protein
VRHGGEVCALRKESPMADLLEAAQQGNGPRVEVAPPHMVATEFRGLCQQGCCCRSVASTLASRFHGRSIHLGLFSYRPIQELLNDAAKAGNLSDRLRFTNAYALQPSSSEPNFGFVRAAVRFHGRLFTLAVIPLLLGGTSGGRYAQY